MKKVKLFLMVILVSVLVISQAAVAFAAPQPDAATLITGAVTSVELETDITTGVTTILVTVDNTSQGSHTVRISEETAYDLGLLDYDDDGNPYIMEPLPGYIEIDSTIVIPDEEESHHPVATALTTFFSDVEGVNYNTIMDAHAAGNGFGVIAQALWMMRKLDGTADDFANLLEAKKNGDYSDFPLEDGTVPTSWGQLRKAVANNLGTVMSHKDKDNNGNSNGNGNSAHPGNGNKDKDKDKDKSNNGNDNSNGNGGNGNKP